MKTPSLNTLMASAMILSTTAFAADGDLDTTYNTTGFNSTSFGATDNVYGGALQSDGKLLVIGGARPVSSQVFGVARFNANGSLDTGFGTSGKYSLDITTTTTTDRATCGGVQSDGKIIIGGWTRFASGNDNFAVIRLTSAGVLDTTFGSAGVAQVDFNGSNDRANGLVVLPDDSIVLVGFTWVDSGGTDADFGIAKLTPGGALDTSFDSDGKATVNVGNQDDTAYRVDVQADGKIVFCGSSNSSGTTTGSVGRLNANGSLDTTFGGGDGVFSGGFSFRDVKAQTDGKIIACGDAAPGGSLDGSLTRLTSAGALDTTFNSTGTVNINFGTGSDLLQSVIQQADGKYVAGGLWSNSGTSLVETVMVKVTAAGALDTTFATTGVRKLAIGTGNNRLATIHQASDGKILAALESSSMDFFAARFLNTVTMSASAPTVTTATQSGVTHNSATLGGNVTADGGASVTDRGIVWGTSANPTTGDNKVQIGTGTGVFSQLVTGLPPSTTVHVRAYAINTAGTSYGNEISFATLSNNADLSALAVTTATLNEAFSPATTAYTASVPNGTTSVTVTATRAEANATLQVRVNGGGFTSLTSGVASGALPLNVGANPIDVRVTAQDGTTIKTYTTTVTRAWSSVSTLTAHSYSAGSIAPPFASGTLNYSLAVPTGTISTTMTAVKADANSTVHISINGGGFLLVPGVTTGSLGLNVGDNTFITRVTAEDGVTTTSYTTIITRAAPPATFDLAGNAVSNTPFDGGESYIYVTNSAPVISSNGGGASAAINVAENSTTVTTVTAADSDLPAQTLTYSITGGADQALFSIVPSTGVLTFASAPDFETPADTGTNNVYEVIVTVTDNGAGLLTDMQTISVTITNVNEMPSFVKGAGQLLPYNTSSAQTAAGWATAINDGDSTVTQALTFNISSNSNPGLFTTAPSINSSTGTLTYTPNGTAGTATIGVTLTDDNTINSTAALTSAEQTFTITVQAAPDYTLVTTATSVTITDMSGNGNNLSFTDSGPHATFADSGRTFSLNGGLNETGSINLTYASLPTIESIVINAAAGNDMVNIGVFSAMSDFPSLTVNGGTGDDTVNFNGGITFDADANLDADLQNDDVTPGVDRVNVASNVNLVTSGTGTITVKVSRSISLASGSSLSSENGDITLEAHVAGTLAGSFRGITLTGASISTSGTGDIELTGKGGLGSSGLQTGVHFESASVLAAGGSGAITITGTGGAGTNFVEGVGLSGVSISVVDGDLLITGTGGAGTGLYDTGVRNFNSQISSTGTGSITIVGTAGTGTTEHYGISFGGASASVTSSGSGTITLQGSAAAVTTYAGVQLGTFGAIAITSSSGTGAVNLIGDDVRIDATNATISAGANPVTIRQITNGTAINLGAADSAGTLGLTDAELDRITSGTLNIGNADSGTITVSAPISRTANTAMQLISAADILISGGQINTAGGGLLLDSGTSPAAVKPTLTGTDVTVGTLSFGSDLEIAINGAVADTGYTQLNVVGSVDLTGVTLALTGAHVPLFGQSFTLVNNDGTDAITGTFTGLAEGTVVTFNGIPLQLSYVGGTDSNDVVLAVYTPEIAVHNGSHTLAPELTDGQIAAVDFGSTSPNAASVRSFTVTNSGNADLIISSISVPAAYTTTGAATTVAPGTNYTFQVALESATPATYTGSITINSDDLNEAAFDFPVTGTVVPAGSAPVVTVSTDVAVEGPGGAPVLGGPPGSTIYKFIGSPALNSSGVLASAVQIRHADTSLHTGMMVGQPLVLIATDTQTAPSLPGVTHYSFGPPVINEVGHIAFTGEVRGAGITTNVNSRCLFSNASDGTLKLVARVGTSVGLTSDLKTIGNFSIGGDLIIFLGTLVDNSTVLFGWDANTGLRPLMRNGQSLDANGVTKTVQSFNTLETSNASSGHGREISVAPTGESLVTLGVAFTDGSSGVVLGSFDGTSDTGFGATYGASQQLADTYAAPPAIPLARWNTFRSPGFDNTGSYYGFISQMVNSSPAGVFSTNNVGVFVDTAPGVLTLQLRENDVATDTGGLVFSDFSDLVLGGGDYEFLVKGEVRGSGVVINVNDKGLWAQHATNGLVLVAREGSEAPGVAGSTFFRLTQMALPGTAQPMFQASMTAGAGGVTAANDTGLWVINAGNNVVLAVREGDVLNVGGTNRSVTAITALLNGTTTGGALGRRVFLADGQLTLLLTFSGGVQANAKVVVP